MNTIFGQLKYNRGRLLYGDVDLDGEKEGLPGHLVFGLCTNKQNVRLI